MIEFKNVSKKYMNKSILKDVSFSIEDGEFFVIVGLSGSGKTTLMKMMNRLIVPDDGDILIDGIEIGKWDKRNLRHKMGYVIQHGALFPNLTIRENIALIPRIKKWDKDEVDIKINTLMPIIGLDAKDYLDKYPNQLSGGEQQRIGILRAIITEPKFLLMDEPFSALDPLIRRELQMVIKNLHERLGISIVFVTHNMREAVMLADRIGVVSGGHLLQVDSPEKMLKNPNSDFVRRLFESEDLI